MAETTTACVLVPGVGAFVALDVGCSCSVSHMLCYSVCLFAVNSAIDLLKLTTALECFLWLVT